MIERGAEKTARTHRVSRQKTTEKTENKPNDWNQTQTTHHNPSKTQSKNKTNFLKPNPPLLVRTQIHVSNNMITPQFKIPKIESKNSRPTI